MPLNLADLPFPLTIRPATFLTDEELIHFSNENKPYKIERTAQGELTVMTPVGGIGSTHEAYVFGSFYIWNESDARGLAFGSNAGFNLPDGSCLSPDVAWLSLQRWDDLSPAQRISFPPLCPEFVIEIRSASDPRRLLDTKMQLWLINGAQLAWLIDPIENTVTMLRPNAPDETLVRPAVITGAGPVAGFELRTARLWTTP